MVGTTFVGRQGELGRLGRVLRGDPGAASAAVVTGDAGIGKTRLFREAVRAAPEVNVLVGACLPLSESLPYGAVTDALAVLSSPDSRPTLDKALVRCPPFVRRQVSALIPALDVEPRDVADAAVDRTRLFAALRDLLAALGAEQRTALVIEDLHWADPGTLDLLTFLVHGLRPGTALIASSRRDELRSEHPTLNWLAAAARTQEVETVALAPLPPDDTRALVESLVGDQRTGVVVADVLRRGEGSPFFTEQLVAASRGLAPTQKDLPGVPPGVAQMLLERVRSVSADGIEVAAALSVAARPLSKSELAVCVGTGARVAAGLRELLDAHLAEPAHQDRYRLRHALLEDTVRGTLLSSQRATLHAGVAEVLAARDGDAAPAEVAAHWGRAGNKVEEARWSVDAARHAERVFAWREASSSWRRVWDLWGSLPGDAQPVQELSEAVLGCLSGAINADDHDTFMRLVREALADERVTTDDQVTGLLLLMYGNRLVLKDVPSGLATLERALELFDRSGKPSVAQAATLIRVVLAKILHNYLPTGTEDAELARATAIAEQLGELGVLLHAESLVSMWRLQAGSTDDGLADLSTILQRARDANMYGWEAWVAACLADGYRWLMRFTDGIDVGRHSIGRVLDHGVSNIYYFALLVANTVDCLLLTGDVDAAEQLVAPHAFSDATNAGWPLHLARAELDLLAGNFAGAIARAEQVDAMGYHLDEMHMGVAAVGATADLWQRKPRSGLQRIDLAWAVVHASPRAARASRMLALAARAAADLADTDFGVDRGALADTLLESARQAECFVPHPARVLGAAYGTTFDAELARLRRGDQEPAWRKARDTWAGGGVPHQAGYAGWRLAECLLSSGHRKHAGTELAAAYVSAAGHQPLRGEIRALARRARLALPALDARPPEPATPGDIAVGFTPRELDVLRLLGTGATNAEIGRRLYMSPKTASVHVTAILRKLGVTGRVQAATVAERMGLLDHE
jgi:DNA-binding CsgD family transcriptional regulator